MKNYYSVLNECAVKNQVLFAGSTFAHDFPINELMQDFDVDARVYNRSEKGAKLADARDFVMEQAEALEPSKIFLCFGDEDIKAEGFLAGEFSYEYKELVSDIQKKFPDCQIYILPVMADGAEEADNALKNICGDIAEFIPLSAEAKHDAGKIFRELKTFLHGRNVIFGQAWN